jgi:hypothetical protein
MAAGALVAACSSTARERPGQSVEAYQPPVLEPPPESPRLPSAAPDETEPSAAADAPEISRSRGEAGGVVVLWPRMVLPRSGQPKPDAQMRALAAKLQQRLVGIAKRALPGKRLDVRPEPERVCPRPGCQGVSLGVLLTRAGGGCAAVALISGPGASPARLVPWAAQMQLSEQSVPFRQPPERAVEVTDYVRCTDLERAAAAGDTAVEQALRDVQR